MRILKELEDVKLVIVDLEVSLGEEVRSAPTLCAKYKGKIIQVKGTIRDIGNDIMDEAYVTLIGDEFFGDVRCFFSDKSYLIDVKKGQNINVVGYCDGLFINVIMKNCIIK